MSRWYQLLSSIVTRQRLNNRYVEANDSQKTNDKLHNNASTSNEDIQKPTSHGANENASKHVVRKTFEEDHEHVFVTSDPSSDVESSVRTKRCHCGFSIEVEEL